MLSLTPPPFRVPVEPGTHVIGGGQVLQFGFKDHHGPPLNLLYTVCNAIDSWLKASPDHVAVVHCKAGKGRTGTGPYHVTPLFRAARLGRRERVGQC